MDISMILYRIKTFPIKKKSNSKALNAPTVILTTRIHFVAIVRYMLSNFTSSRSLRSQNQPRWYVFVQLPENLKKFTSSIIENPIKSFESTIQSLNLSNQFAFGENYKFFPGNFQFEYFQNVVIISPLLIYTVRYCAFVFFFAGKS